jgi:iron complex outermembrane receptor protein
VTQRIGDSLAKDKPTSGGTPACRSARTASSTPSAASRKRTGDSAGFFRSAGDGRNVPAVYPNGFLPNIRTTVKDASLAFGYRRDLAGDWKFDASVNHGRSELDFHEKNTINVSYWYEPKPGGGIYAESPLEADTGTLKFRQTTFNPTCAARSSVGGRSCPGHRLRIPPRRLPDRSRRSGLLPVRPHQQPGDRDPRPDRRHRGLRHPGLPRLHAGHRRRRQAATTSRCTLDAEHKPTTAAAGGGRALEKYSDFGSTTTGKLSAALRPDARPGLRGSVSTGFRAPSVQQKFYSSVSTNLNAAGVLTETLTAREGSAVTRPSASRR